MAIAIVGLVSCKNEMKISDSYFIFGENLHILDPIPPFGAEKDLYRECELQCIFSGVNLTVNAFDDTWFVFCDANWCRYEYTTDSFLRGGGHCVVCSLKLSVTLDENTTGKERDANINITCNGQPFQLTITQLGAPEVIVTRPGTLTQELANKDLLYSTSIKISGELNDKDLETIKELREIETLDLTGAIIDDLPDEMFYMNETIKQVKLPETIKVIHPRTFAFSSLEYIYFPASIETIEDGEYDSQNTWIFIGAFANSSLTTIEFAPYSRLKYIGDYAFAGAGKERYTYDGEGEKIYCEELEIIFPASVETMGDGVFSSNTNNYLYNTSRLTDVSVLFEEQSLLKTVGNIDAYSLDFNARNCQKLQSFGTIVSDIMTLGTHVPPICRGYVVGSYLYVPKGCVGAYYDADGWKEFETIEEIGQE